ncbi:MAG: hypothetical protein Q4C22_05015 [Bacillota bacterium]|nr:hypothetical protein [Bacillota bacterium]
MKRNRMDIAFGKVVKNGITPYLTREEAVGMYSDAMLRNRKLDCSKEAAARYVAAALDKLDQVGSPWPVDETIAG